MNQRTVARVIAILALLGGLSLQCIGAWTDSQTTDEAVHLSAGLSYWRTGDFRLNPEHPPLIKLLAALPLVPKSQLQPSADPTLWANRSQWDIGRLVLYHQLNPRTETQSVLWLARLPMILVWLILGLIVWRWAEERTTPWGGAAAAILFAFEPTLLGHGHLITTDVGIATGMTATFGLATKLVARPRWRLVLLIASVFSLTQLTKFSALMLWPMFFGLLAAITFLKQSAWTWQWWRRTLGITVVVSAVLTWMVYGFEVVPAGHDPRIDRLWHERDALVGSAELPTLPPYIQYLVKATPPGSGLRQTLYNASRVPIPAYSFWRGVFAVSSHNAMGHTSYLLGEQRQEGWWYYFPVALAVKTTLPMIALFGALLVVAWQRRQRLLQPNHILLYAPAILYLLWSLTSKINIGVRHVLPLYPLVIIGCAHLVPIAIKRWQRLALWITVAMVPIIALAAWPNTLGYFNAFAGGTNGGHRIILDSNLDWNQDLWRLRDYLDARSIPPARIALFGSVPVEVVHPHAQRVPTDEEVASAGRPTGLVIVSQGMLYSVDVPFHWLRTETPVARIGSSILVFDFR